jgi:Ca2+-binding EF-hand superfamily protein
MISDVKENNERLFVISYYLSDDTVQVHELSCRNFGFRGGEFIGKSKIFIPGQQKFTSERPIAYKSQDFYLGAVVCLRDYIFKITSADLFALKFMEEHQELYPMSHAHLILSKVKNKLAPIYKDFIACYMTKVKAYKENEMLQEFIGYEDFKTMLHELLGDEITEQEIVTLCRHFSITTKKSPREFREMLRSIVQGEIYRELWSDIDRMKEFIYHISPNNVDYLSERDLMRVIRGCKVPLDIAIINQLFTVLNRNECNEFEVADFINFIDLKECKAPPVPPINAKVRKLL